jgi:hypothetical protein
MTTKRLGLYVLTAIVALCGLELGERIAIPACTAWSHLPRPE